MIAHGANADPGTNTADSPERLGITRLFKHRVEAAIPQKIAADRAGRMRHDRRPCAGMVSFKVPDLSCRRQAVQHRHLQIHQDEVEVVSACERDRLGAVRRQHRRDPPARK
jgi:hypothetical protein